MSTPRPRPARATLAGLVALVALVALASGCSSSSSDDSEGAAGLDASLTDSGGDAGSVAAPEEAADGLVARDADSTADEEVGPAEQAYISTGTVSLETDDVEATRLDVRKVLDRFRGEIAEQEAYTGDGDLTSARLVLRVPSDDFDAAMAALEDLATLTSSTSGSENVSTEVVDVDARVRAQRRSVERITALLARADSIEQVVAIESQLASRQAELDALLARQAWLADQTSQSTITVYLELPGNEGPEEDPDGFLGGLEDGWDSFVTGLGAALTVVGFLVPWLLVVALLGTPVWLLVRRRRRVAQP